jgi:hypothetical protein
MSRDIGKTMVPKWNIKIYALSTCNLNTKKSLMHTNFSTMNTH